MRDGCHANCATLEMLQLRMQECSKCLVILGLPDSRPHMDVPPIGLRGPRPQGVSCLEGMRTSGSGCIEAKLYEFNFESLRKLHEFEAVSMYGHHRYAT